MALEADERRSVIRGMEELPETELPDPLGMGDGYLKNMGPHIRKILCYSLVSYLKFQLS
jgi:hypothetical protein